MTSKVKFNVRHRLFMGTVYKGVDHKSLINLRKEILDVMNNPVFIELYDSKMGAGAMWLTKQLKLFNEIKPNDINVFFGIRNSLNDKFN